MSASEQVSKLEALLERVNTRRNAPRTTAAAAAPAAHDDVIARVEATPTAVNPIVPKPAPSTPKLPDAVAAKPAAAAVPAPAPTPSCGCASPVRRSGRASGAARHRRTG